VLEERDEGRGDADDLGRRHVEVLDLVGLDVLELAVDARDDAGLGELAPFSSSMSRGP